MKLLVKPGEKISMKDFDPSWTGAFSDKDEALEKLTSDIERMSELQDKLYADNRYGLLIIFQALDAAGKDGTIKHVMSGINPQGCHVVSFKNPSAEELDHDYLWRCEKNVPEKGRIGIFNRSYYEEVLAVRVHPEFLENQHLPNDGKNGKIWKQRFEQINSFEKYLTENGIVILKFYLNVSKKEQKKRFLERIDKPEKNWKFSAADVKEREHWDDYMNAYEDVFNNTSTDWAPWFVIPADKKWFTRTTVAGIIVQTLEELKLEYPTVSKQHLDELQKAKQILLEEK
ncbi:MAG: polyphosphate kinase 2 family protein [Bacteroidetes bacterium]|nr:polyphosphate kinase 2 family protein [Bacteroidota bacterium]